MSKREQKLRQLVFPGENKLAERMGAALVGMGVLHFVAPAPFDGIIPPELPGSPRAYTYGSGVAEIAIGAAMLAPRTRRHAGLASVLLFVGVYPGNINMVRMFKDKPLPFRVAVWGRLPLQFPMIWAGWKVWKA
ncbi:DoxX family protein [Williamsia soli]|uniref:DoxX family protein n=1 Tax=Williamsia soli TaxID=364929 RepID=UPI001A9D99DF|nr:hypothetical protein [Williamsia soli]